MNGERAALREKELTRPLETGAPPPAELICVHSAKYMRKRAHRINRRHVRRELQQAMEELVETEATFTSSPSQPTEAELREARRQSWMYHKCQSCGAVTVTAGRVYFNGSSEPKKHRRRSRKVQEQVFSFLPQPC